jgi:hypothetical protein
VTLDIRIKDKTRQGKSRQGKTRQGKTRQDKTRLVQKCAATYIIWKILQPGGPEALSHGKQT